jgi:hypothetical protein
MQQQGYPPQQPGYPGQPNAMQPAHGSDPFAGADAEGGFISDVKAGFALLKPVLIPVILLGGMMGVPLV